MKSLKTELATIIGAFALLVSSFTTSAVAVEWGSIGVGVSFGGAHAEVAGKENGSTKEESATEDGQTGIASAYAQITLGDQWFGKGNGLTFGYETFYGEATFKKVNNNITDMKGSATGALTTVTQHAEAMIENINTMYIETPGFTPLGIFLKAGWSEMDVRTKEDLGTGGSYGDAAVDGAMVGGGFKKSVGNFHIKTEFNYTDWDALTLSNVGTATTGSTSITATPEVWSGKIGIGIQF